jgi:membrane protein DedA with SNARE-associated domain
MDALLSFLGDQGPFLLYALLGAGAALENLIPPIPADTFVLLGAFLAAGGRATALVVFLVTWLANSFAAMLVYRAGVRYGQSFFQAGIGRRLLNRHQLERLGSFYSRWGLPAIFFARFLPGLRAMVPVFAGVTKQRFLPVAFPVLVASGIWYGGLVWVGATAGKNLPAIQEWISHTNRVLLGIAVAMLAIAGLLWHRTRRGGQGGTAPGREEEHEEGRDRES